MAKRSLSPKMLILAGALLLVLVAWCHLVPSQEKYVNFGPGVFREIDNMRDKVDQDCSMSSQGQISNLPAWKKSFCPINPCYGQGGPRPGFPASDIGGGKCVAPYSAQCQAGSKKFPESYYPCPSKKENMSNGDVKEGFGDWTLYNAPVINGYRPSWFSGPAPPSQLMNPALLQGGYPSAWPNLMGAMGSQYAYPQLAQQNAMDRLYNPLRYPYRSQAFYEQGWYPNMILPPQVIGGGGRRQGLLGGTQVGVPNVYPPIEISNRNIAPVNIMTRGPLGVPQQVGVLYKIFGSLNEALPLFGRKRYPNSDQWDYYTLVGPTGGRVKAEVLTRRRNEELGTNDEVRVRGSKARYRVTIYDSDFPQYIPYA